MAQRSSLAALLFRIEQQYTPDGVDERIDELDAWCSQHEGHERLQALFIELFCVLCL